MKPIALLGGTAWPSTIDYYIKLNMLAVEHLGKEHSADLLIRSIDYLSLRKYYSSSWDQVAKELLSYLEDLDEQDPACIIICNNTLHKCLELIDFKKTIKAPIVSIIDSAIEDLKAAQVKKPLLLATSFVWEDGFVARRLTKEGFTVSIPSEASQERIQEVQKAIAEGQDSADLTQDLIDVCSRHKDCDAILLACTELPAAFESINLKTPIIDPSLRQCEIAFEYYLGKRK